MKYYSSLREYTNAELIELLQHNNTLELRCLSGILSEILRRMNEISPLLPLKEEQDWGNPITP